MARQDTPRRRGTRARTPPPDDSGLRIVRQAADIILKWMAGTLQDALLERFGLALPPIRGPFPTELPRLEVRTALLDYVFDLADDRLLHLEVQTRHGDDDLERFLAYDVALYHRHHRPVLTVVLYGAGVPTAPTTLTGGSFTYQVQAVFLARESAEATLAHLAARRARGEAFGPRERVDLLLAPLMRASQSPEALVRQVLELAQALPLEQRTATLGAVLALTYTRIDARLAERLQEDPIMTSVLETLARRRYEEGREEGRREAVRDTIRLRFGTVPPTLEQRIAQAGAEDLTRLLERALAAERLDDL